VTCRRALLLAPLALALAVAAPAAPAQDVCAAQDPVEPRERCEQEGSSPRAGACAPASGFRSVSARPRRGGALRLGFERRRPRRVTVDVFQHSRGRAVIGNRLVARFVGRRRAVRWSGEGARRGLLSARFTMRLPGGGRDVRRIALERRDGRFVRRPAFARRTACGALRTFKLERPAFGGRRNRSLGIAFRLGRPARVTVAVRRGGRLVRRLGSEQRAAGVTHRLRLGSERLKRGDHVVRLTARPAGGRTIRARLTARRL
jgi:hypothetical protein